MSVPLSSIPSSSAPSTSPDATTAITAAQLGTLSSKAISLLKGSDAASILSQLPSVLIALYKDVVAIYDATQEAQQKVVIQLLESAVGMIPGLPPTELQIIDSVITNFVPVILSYLPKIEAGMVSGFLAAEEDVSGYMAWWKSKCC
jgi:hypothetical protein